MSVLVKGMKMPKSCRKCFIKQESCPAIRKRIQVLPKNNHIYVPYNYRYNDCPLGNVPTPHGRLIDADELQRQFERMANEEWNKNIAVSAASCFDDAAVIVEDAPTIIEAEEET